MGLVRTLQITCDGTTPSGIGPCPATYERPGRHVDVPIAELRRAAKHAGWKRTTVPTHTGKRVIDLCPLCRGGDDRG